ncbi:hypothetical protein FNF29_07028 [Cafeteria roenbergensis]|uniref:NADH:ubiquinone oxidoreductase intermediate-associated protein 30 domain-containing protein n=1 Tax=Cafeteria roenbergensis TaxID=33653 RepID=A0A5A8C5V0_CAFRO|nr:hypothetical protein FNF29_07028 [Cafeteria roenbergensis]|eukprot:KAA0147939.1 hypothetical protein FNF29_07028 [Cafeteria roenbergensis]
MLMGDPSARVAMPSATGVTVPMYAFRNEEEAARYLITTDELFGGKSRATMRVKQYKHFMAGVFEGVVDWTSEDRESRGGFCNVRLRERKPVREDDEEMMATEGVQLRVKTDGRPFLLNFQCRDTTDEDVWQAEVRTAPFRWETLALPWSGFAHVSRGLVREVQMNLEPHKIDGFGLTVADGRNGPFRCEVQHVVALGEWRDELDELRGPTAGQTADGRRVTPYTMTDDQRSQWRNSRDRAGRRRIMDEFLQREGKPGGVADS